jgi:hypothetical protein
MKTKGKILIGVGVLGAVVIASMIIKKKVKVVPVGSGIDKYMKKNPKSVDSTGVAKVPYLTWILSKKS